METSYENVIEEVVQSIFATMLNFELIRTAESAAEQEPLLTAVQIAGEWTGSIVLAMSPGMARASAAAMLAMEPSEVNDSDLRDVAAELTNMIGGNVKSLLPGPSFLSLPSIITGSDFGLQFHHALMIEDVSMQAAAGSLRVRLYTKIPEPEHSNS
jgi:chemotaxis protein CheX